MEVEKYKTCQVMREVFLQSLVLNLDCSQFVLLYGLMETQWFTR